MSGPEVSSRHLRRQPHGGNLVHFFNHAMASDEIPPAPPIGEHQIGRPRSRVIVSRDEFAAASLAFAIAARALERSVFSDASSSSETLSPVAQSPFARARSERAMSITSMPSPDLSPIHREPSVSPTTYSDISSPGLSSGLSGQDFQDDSMYMIPQRAPVMQPRSRVVVSQDEFTARVDLEERDALRSFLLLFNSPQMVAELLGGHGERRRPSSGLSDQNFQDDSMLVSPPAATPSIASTTRTPCPTPLTMAFDDEIDEDAKCEMVEKPMLPNMLSKDQLPVDSKRASQEYLAAVKAHRVALKKAKRKVYQYRYFTFSDHHQTESERRALNRRKTKNPNVTAMLEEEQRQQCEEEMLRAQQFPVSSSSAFSKVPQEAEPSVAELEKKEQRLIAEQTVVQKKIKRLKQREAQKKEQGSPQQQQDAEEQPQAQENADQCKKLARKRVGASRRLAGLKPFGDWPKNKGFKKDKQHRIR